ncbi:PREDICTED: uncharacterized protein LOC107171539 [Diuraphis noxia]|uniref:uncharacterized protein LOC107171539 n=1 Tax=Diuraphis noxia TaxID=143948 RepID=UPI000763A1ED|nr:PREDICTED: uncharacterized protein LOC107171539 [Diuraphis noxia]
MIDLFSKFNDINLQLQGNDLNQLYLPSKKKTNFMESAFWSQRTMPVSSSSLDKDFSQRLEDILSLEVPKWVINPFVNIESSKMQYQEELKDISTYEMLKATF